MKIKIVYGVDMRLWRYNLTEDKPSATSYNDLLTYVIKTFEFDDVQQFKITFRDDDDTQTTMTSQADFEDAFTFAKKSEKKSLKLYIVDSAEPHYMTHVEQKEEKQQIIIENEPIQSTIHANTNDNNNNNNNKSAPAQRPTEEEINAFLSNDFTMDLLSDLFVSVFEALQASNFEISFLECTNGVILSSNNKYCKLTDTKVWPYFIGELLPSFAVKIETFMIPMIKMNGINTDTIKQWIPTVLNMMKQHTQNNGGFCGGFKGRHAWKQWRSGRGRGGHCRGWRGRHKHGRRGHHGHHGQHVHHGHHGHHHRGRGRGGYQQQNYGQYQQYQATAPPHNEDDQIEAEVFEYTEELVSIMNMGFTNMIKIKQLLNQHKGNKSTVVQELVSAK